MCGHIGIEPLEELIKDGLPAVSDQYQRPPVQGLHDHQVPHQGDFGQRAGTAGEGERRVRFMDEGMQPFHQRFLADLFHHPGICFDGTPGFDIFTGHADDMSARFLRAA